MVVKIFFKNYLSMFKYVGTSINDTVSGAATMAKAVTVNIDTSEIETFGD